MSIESCWYVRICIRSFQALERRIIFVWFSHQTFPPLSSRRNLPLTPQGHASLFSQRWHHISCTEEYTVHLQQAHELCGPLMSLKGLGMVLCDVNRVNWHSYGGGRFGDSRNIMIGEILWHGAQASGSFPSSFGVSVFIHLVELHCHPSICCVGERKCVRVVSCPALCC